MGLFVKKQFEDSRQLYSVSLGNTKLLVGLGNVGKEYDNTRHNIGFEVVDAFVEKNGGNWREQKDLKCFLADVRLSGVRFLVIKPTTFMNNSGEAVAAVQSFYKIMSKDTIVVHDELDVPFGQIRVRFGGGSAGHNGVKSLIAHNNENTSRIRVGIGPKLHESQDSADFVLGKFPKEQLDSFDLLNKEAINAITSIALSDEAKPETLIFLI